MLLIIGNKCKIWGRRIWQDKLLRHVAMCLDILVQQEFDDALSKKKIEKRCLVKTRRKSMKSLWHHWAFSCKGPQVFCMIKSIMNQLCWGNTSAFHISPTNLVIKYLNDVHKKILIDQQNLDKKVYHEDTWRYDIAKLSFCPKSIIISLPKFDIDC